MGLLIAERGRRTAGLTRATACLAGCRRRGSVLSVATLLLMAASLRASATTIASANLSVSAVISGGCAVSTARVPVGIGALTVTNLSTALNGTGAVSTDCTPGTNAVITLDRVGAADAPTAPAIAAGPNSVAYPLSQSSRRRAFVWGSDGASAAVRQGHTSASAEGPSGAIGAANGMPAGAQEAPAPTLAAGSHSDTVLATVTF
jgi:spore coat protein U-like protein